MIMVIFLMFLFYYRNITIPFHYWNNGSLSMMILSGLMLYDLFIRESQVNIVLEPLFWIASGVLLFNAGEFGYYLFSNYLINDGIDKAATFFSQLNSKLIFVLYSCIVIGFVCHRITEKYKKG